MKAEIPLKTLLLALAISTIVCIVFSGYWANRFFKEYVRHDVALEAIEATRSSEVRVIYEK